MAERGDNCAACTHLAVDRDRRGWPQRGKPGFCRLRDLPIDHWVDTWCDNQQERNVLSFQAPVGPVWIGRLPIVLGGVPYVEEGVGEPCGQCEGATPGPRQVVWLKDDRRQAFCDPNHYLVWAATKNPHLAGRTEPAPEDVSEIRRLHRGLCEAESGMHSGEPAPLHKLEELYRFTGPALYRFLRARRMLPRPGIHTRWPDLFRGAPKQTRERLSSWTLEVELSLFDLFRELPDGVPEDASDLAFEYARLRWARMVVGDLVEQHEGPETPKDVDKRFRGRHRPQWKDGETENPAHARRSFYLERNPDLADELTRYFSATKYMD